MVTGRVEVRRVGFRFGTADELAAMHLVESEIDSERWPNRTPRPLEKYVAFAHSLPSHFEDHTWLAVSDDGTVHGCAACWSNVAGDPRVMECYVYVRPSWRGQGVGRQLAEAVIEEARTEDRLMLVWSTYDSVPTGESFSHRLGGSVVRVNRNSELQLWDLDDEMLRSWIDGSPGRASGYNVVFVEGPYPPDLLEDAARFHNIMNTAPRDRLEVGDTVLEPQQVAEIDRHLGDSGRERWTMFVNGPDGRCMGGTEVTFEAWNPTIGFQQDTAIDPAHRGQGLAKWVKAALLVRIRTERPEVDRISTGNAFSNEPMLAINRALGFKVVEVLTEWQGGVHRLHRSLP